MPRNVLVSNGRFAVALDDKARIRDVYFPYVGLENHAVGHQFRFGVWVNSKFEWLEEDWDIVMTYLPETLTSRYKIRKRKVAYCHSLIRRRFSKCNGSSEMGNKKRIVHRSISRTT